MKQFIFKHFGSVSNCADELGVSKNPRGVLKHAPEIVASKNITWTQLSGEVLFQEDELVK